MLAEECSSWRIRVEAREQTGPTFRRSQFRALRQAFELV